MSVAAVVLAAGFSRRLGHPKQSAVVGGEMLVQRAVRVAREAGLEPVLVVARREAEFAAALHDAGCTVLINDEAAEGMASSVRVGIAAAEGLSEVAGAVVMTCDQVAVRAAHLRALCAEPERVNGSKYAGRVGVPAYFPRASFAALLKLRGDAGARELLRGAAAVAMEELALDVDTAEDLARAREMFGA